MNEQESGKKQTAESLMHACALQALPRHGWPQAQQLLGLQNHALH
jgi:hypothetical protein